MAHGQRFSGQTARRYDEHAEHSRRALFAKDREIRKLTGELLHARSTLDYIKAVVSGEVGGHDREWQLAQVLEAAGAFFAKWTGAARQADTETIVRWDEVREGDEVLHIHRMIPVLSVEPRTDGGRMVLLPGMPWPTFYRDEWLVAVRRKTEG